MNLQPSAIVSNINNIRSSNKLQSARGAQTSTLCARRTGLWDNFEVTSNDRAPVMLGIFKM